MININNAVQFQHLLWDRIIGEAQVVVDATCGNGHDLLYLVKQAKENCHFYAIDVQEQAIQATQHLLMTTPLGKGVSITYTHGSHDRVLSREIQEDALDLVVFNLGYLPGADKSLMTKSPATIGAVEAALQRLRKGGVVTIAAYPGTPEGQEEENNVRAFVKSLDQKLFNVCYWTPLNQINHPPVLYMLQKR